MPGPADNQDGAEFKRLLEARLPSLSTEKIAKMVQFRDLVLAENEKQNLTRLTSPQDFLEGHVLDAWELLNSGFLTSSAMDLGSGVGVPGIPAVILGGGTWVLCESEGRKAEFLARAALELGLEGVQVAAARAEEYLRSHSVESIVARAVGSVEKIYSLLRKCSTWNSLVLMKGPAWEEEWSSFSNSKFKAELSVRGSHRYTVGEKTRVIVCLDRHVPRGTISRGSSAKKN